MASKAALVSEVNRLLRQFGQRWKAELHPHLAGLGLSPPQLWVLQTVEGEVPMSTVAERLGIDPSYVTALADQLETMGLVQRRPDPSDRRIRRLCLTRSGRKMQARAAEVIEATSPIAVLCKSDLKDLARLLGAALKD